MIEDVAQGRAQAWLTEPKEYETVLQASPSDVKSIQGRYWEKSWDSRKWSQAWLAIPQAYEIVLQRILSASSRICFYTLFYFPCISLSVFVQTLSVKLSLIMLVNLCSVI